MYQEAVQLEEHISVNTSTMLGDVTHQEAVKDAGDGVAARGPAAKEALLGRLPALVARGLCPQPRAVSLAALLLRLLGGLDQTVLSTSRRPFFSWKQSFYNSKTNC